MRPESKLKSCELVELEHGFGSISFSTEDTHTNAALLASNSSSTPGAISETAFAAALTQRPLLESRLRLAARLFKAVQAVSEAECTAQYAAALAAASTTAQTALKRAVEMDLDSSRLGEAALAAAASAIMAREAARQADFRVESFGEYRGGPASHVVKELEALLDDANVTISCSFSYCF
jgi:D-serine deaminase-like pyridoxal phosphate-dependent protein